MSLPLSRLRDGIAARYIFTIMAFFGFVFNYMLRVNINFTIVAMVNYSAIERTNDTGLNTECGSDSGIDPYDPANDGPFAWNENAQSTIVSSFYWGYISTQILGGRLSEMMGGKKIFGTSIILSGILNLAIPFLSSDNPLKLIVLRIVLGMCQGPTFPGMHAMIARWAPQEERSWISSLVYSGYLAGTLATYPMAGFFTNMIGWESVFYIFGGVSFIWGILWFYLVFDSPDVHPRISKEELKYLQARTQALPKSLPIPWRAMFTSMPFWAIVVGDLANNWGFTMLLSEIPIYMKHILHYDLTQSSFLSALPYLCMWAISIVFGYVASILVRKDWMSVKNIRKIATMAAQFGGAAAMIGVTLTGCNNSVTLFLLNAAVGLGGAYHLGGMTNHIDIAPNFAGSMMGITNGLGQVPALLAPLTAGMLTNGQQTIANWRKIFYISAAVYIVGCTFYVIFADGKVQPWNSARTPDDEERNEEENRTREGKDRPKSRVSTIELTLNPETLMTQKRPVQ